MRSLTFIINFLEILEDVAFFLKSLVLFRDWFRNHPFRGNSCLALLEGINHPRWNDDARSIINTLGKRDWLTILCFKLGSFPIYWKINDTDQFLPSVTDSEQFQIANDKFPWLSSCVRTGYFWGRNVRARRIRVSCRRWMSSSNLIKRNLNFFVLKVRNSSRLLDAVNLWLNEFWIIACATKFEVNIRRNLDFHRV